MKRRQEGLTLIELMVTLAVAIVLLAIGIPAFNAMTARDISAATVNGLVTALQQARMEAISRGVNVFVASADWSKGWTIELASGEDLRVFTAPRPAQVTINPPAVTPVTFTSRGETAANSIFTVSAFKTSDTTATPARVRYICVTRTGQVRTEENQADCPP